MGFREIFDIGLPLHHGTLNSDLVLETQVSICTPKIKFPDQQNRPRHFFFLTLEEAHWSLDAKKRIVA
jgi:hypothetical protein